MNAFFLTSPIISIGRSQRSRPELRKQPAAHSGRSGTAPVTATPISARPPVDRNDSGAPSRRAAFCLSAWIAALLLCLGALPARADDVVWGALVLGTTEQDPPPVPETLRPYEKAVARVFGHNRLDLMGESEHPFSGPEEAWVIPSREFFLRVTRLREAQGRHRLNLQLFHGQKLLVESEAILGRDTPILFRGPQWGRGQLVILLAVRPSTGSARNP